MPGFLTSFSRWTGFLLLKILAKLVLAVVWHGILMTFMLHKGRQPRCLGASSLLQLASSGLSITCASSRWMHASSPPPSFSSYFGLRFSISPKWQQNEFSIIHFLAELCRPMMASFIVSAWKYVGQYIRRAWRYVTLSLCYSKLLSRSEAAS